jgi:hypothetical protein
MSHPFTLTDLYRFDFRTFVEFAFNELHPGKRLIPNWHIDVVADRLMTAMPDAGARLILNVPPRHLKSICATIAWPLFVLARSPGVRICVFAGTRELAANFSELRLRLLRSKRLQAIFPNLKFQEITDGLRFANGSELIQTVVHRSQIGRGADVIIIDDPMSPADAQQEKKRKALIAWYDGEIVPRLNNKASASVVVVMQRLHQHDFCADLFAGRERWASVVMPALAADDEEWRLSDGNIHRREFGDALFPALEDRDALRARLNQVGGYHFHSQYLQAPVASATRTQHFGFWAYDGWEPGMPIVSQGMGQIDVAVDVRRTYFGERVRGWRPGLRNMTPEESAEHGRLQQVRLYAQCQADRERR